MSRRSRRVDVGPPDVQGTQVPVPADDLFDWVTWIGWISTALEQAAETTRVDLNRHLPDGVCRSGLHCALEQAQERIGALLNGDGWWQS